MRVFNNSENISKRIENLRDYDAGADIARLAVDFRSLYDKIRKRCVDICNAPVNTDAVAGGHAIQVRIQAEFVAADIVAA